MATKRNTTTRAPTPRKVSVDANQAELQGQIAAVGKAQAVIEFELDGTIITANENFLNTVGYRLEEIKGQHHSMFVEPGYRASDEYRRFWEKLGRGEYDANQYKRIAKGGREVWIQASYNPIFDAEGKLYKVVKYATDITAQVKLRHEMEQLVAQTQEVIAAAVDGNLSGRLDTQGKSAELQKLGEAINSLVETVSDVVSNVKQAASEVLRGAEEISQGNANLSQRTEEQSSSLEETASSMEEMTYTVKQNADSAGQANQMAAAARDQAEKGGAVVSNAVEAMGDINESSKKISDIISVIDEIAFQTNLLALNAASREQSSGIEQVNKDVMQMDEMTQQECRAR